MVAWTSVTFAHYLTSGRLTLHARTTTHAHTRSHHDWEHTTWAAHTPPSGNTVDNTHVTAFSPAPAHTHLTWWAFSDVPRRESSIWRGQAGRWVGGGGAFPTTFPWAPAPGSPCLLIPSSPSLYGFSIYIGADLFYTHLSALTHTVGPGTTHTGTCASTLQCYLNCTTHVYLYTHCTSVPLWCTTASLFHLGPAPQISARTRLCRYRYRDCRPSPSGGYQVSPPWWRACPLSPTGPVEVARAVLGVPRREGGRQRCGAPPHMARAPSVGRGTPWYTGCLQTPFAAPAAPVAFPPYLLNPR